MLLAEMRVKTDPPNLDAAFQCLFVDADLNVYPNVAECAPWWRLGNLKKDGAEKILKTYQSEETPGMRANRTIQVRELAGRYGDPESARLYAEGDLSTRFLRQWGLGQYRTNPACADGCISAISRPQNS